MKVLFVQPYYENIWESIGLGYIISYAKKNYQGDLKVEFAQGNFDGDATIVYKARDADIVAFSCTSPAYPHALRLAGEIKAKYPSVRTVFGGWHPTALPNIVDLPEIDQVVLGEGEQAFLDILNGDESPIIQGNKPSFDELPWPDREAIKNYRTVDLCESMNGKRITSFQGNRVCPVNCSFCSERIVTGRFNKKTNPIRSRDAVDLMNEIESVTDDLNLNYFKFVDATFDISPQYVIDFCEEKIRRGNTTEWECLIHASFANREMFGWLKEANCNQVNVGCESGSDKILRQVGKGLKVETITNVFRWAREFKIERRGFFLLGMPGETRDDILLTEQLIDDIEPDVVGFTILCPYPGTEHYDPELHKNVDWEKADEYSNDFWRTPHFTIQN